MHIAHMVRIFGFSFISFLKIAAFKKNSQYEMILKWKHLSNEYATIKQAAMCVYSKWEVRKYGIIFYINLANGKANGIADNSIVLL